MFILLDLILVAVILAFVFICYKKGFINTVVETVGIIVAIIIAVNVSTPLASITYDKLIQPSIVKSVEEQVNLDKITNQDFSSDFTAEKIWDAMPKFIKSEAEKIGVGLENITESVKDGVNNNIEDVTKNILQKIVKPIVVRFIGIIYLIILAIIFIILAKFIAKILTKLFSFTLIGTANQILGGIVGLLKGTVVAFILCMVLTFIISLTKDGFWIFTVENIQKTYIFKLITQISPFNIF